jgi:uncharacterized protein YcbX
MESQQGHEVTGIRIFPVSGQPGQSLGTATVEAGGLAGDRRKKSPVHLVSSAQPDVETVRANLVVTLTPDELEACVGSVLLAGSARLAVTTIPSGCPGVYATVETPGVVSVGDPVSRP